MDLATFAVQLLNGVQYGLVLFLVASGLTLVFGILGVINLAHGAFYMLGAYVAFTLSEHLTGALGFWSAFVLSALRLAYDTKVVMNAAPIQNWLTRLGEGLYSRETPDGYPLTSAAGSGPGQLALRFEIARQIGSSSAGLFKPAGPDSVDHPAFPLIANSLYFNSLQQTLSASTRPALDQAASPQEWNTIFLSSPEFMR